MASPVIVDVTLTSAVTVVALISAGLGVWLATAPRAGRALVPFGAGLLVGMSAFGVWPETAGRLGVAGGLAVILAGFAFLWFVDRYVHPVCPSCSHAHDHGSCSVALHGFALPLVAAAVLHSFMDGLAVAASRREGEQGLAWGVFLAVAVHKIPEGLAYGTILRAALRSRVSALALCVLTQIPTVAGGALESEVSLSLGDGWMLYPLALAGGSFLYLGLHAIHGEFRRRGAFPALGPALTGAAGAAVFLQGIRVFAAW